MHVWLLAARSMSSIPFAQDRYTVTGSFSAMLYFMRIHLQFTGLLMQNCQEIFFLCKCIHSIANLFFLYHQVLQN